MQRLVPIGFALWLVGCATAPPPRPGTSGPPDAIRQPEMVMLQERVRRAQARGELKALQASLEDKAKERLPWQVVESSFAQMPTDADGAWNRLSEVTGAVKANSGAAYWSHLGMADVYLKWAVPDRATVEIAAALAAFPDTSPAVTRRGNVHRAAGRSSEARADYELALQLAGGAAMAPDAAVELARMEQAAGKNAEAKKYLDDVLAVHTDRIDALLLAAQVDPSGAVVHLQAAVDAAPANPEYKIRLAKYVEESGDLEGALAAWKKVTVGNGNNLDGWRSVARLLAGKDSESEREALTHVVRLAPDDHDAMRRLSVLHEEAGDDDEAAAVLSALIALNENDAELLLRRGRLRRRADELLGAVGDLRDAAAAGAEEAKADLATLSKELGIGGKAISGSANRIYGRIARVLVAVYEEKLKKTPRLGGELTIKVWVEGREVIRGEVIKDTIHDPQLEAIAYWLAVDAKFPKAKAKPYELPFEFSPEN